MRLPIPKLDETIDRYLTALKPIIHDEGQYSETVKIAHEFRDGVGKNLHEKLVKRDKANKHTSYITEPWFDMYLSSRLPLVLNYAPFLAWKADPDRTYMALPIRSTNMVISALRVRRSLVENLLTPEIFHLDPKSDTPFYRKTMSLAPEAIATYVSLVFKAFPLDMSQYSSLFSTTRIPRKNKDQLCKYPNSKHIAVIKNGQFYVFDVLDSSGNIRPAEEIFSCLNHLINLNVPTDLDSITALSAEERNTWADVREKLVSSSKENCSSLELVDSALFTVSLDELTFGEEDKIQGAHNFLHGNSGKQGNLKCNRWFDKSFGLLFEKGGEAALTFEHSWGDGVAVLRVFNEMYKDTTKNRFVGPNTVAKDASKEVKHVLFKLTPELKEASNKADQNWRRFTSSLDINYVICSDLTRDYFKKKRVSPDSMFQLAFQMAFYKTYKTFPTTYESSSTAGFKHGRTEVVRSATNETKAATLAFASGSKSPQELRQLLNACSKKHGELTKEAAMGKGFDRHLFAMRKIAESEGKNLPKIYTDKSYAQANHWTLSTSSLYGSYFSGGGFAPVVADGYGLGYGYVDEKLGVLCSSFKGQRDGKKFVDYFSEALNNIKNVLDQS